MSILAILAKLLKHQAELAATLANTQHVNVWQREQLHLQIRANQADFERFIAQYKIYVEKRLDAPLPAGACPHCLK